jgi:hypothetical protein
MTSSVATPSKRSPRKAARDQSYLDLQSPDSDIFGAIERRFVFGEKVAQRRITLPSILAIHNIKCSAIGYLPLRVISCECQILDGRRPTVGRRERLDCKRRLHFHFAHRLTWLIRSRIYLA